MQAPTERLREIFKYAEHDDDLSPEAQKEVDDIRWQLKHADQFGQCGTDLKASMANMLQK